MKGLGVLALAVVFMAVGGDAMSFQDKLEIWSADLQPGFKIVTDYMDGRRCYCKVPNITTTLAPTTTTTTPPTTTTMTRPTTTTTPESTTTTPESTTTTPESTTTTPESTTTTPASTTTTPESTTTTPESTTTTPESTTTTPVSTTTTPESTTTTPESTTTTPESTTTTPESTTTTPESTTTTPRGGCTGGVVNRTIEVNDITYNDTTVVCEKWESPNYPMPYPDGCTICIFIDLQVRGFVRVSFQPLDTILAINNCEFDRLIFFGSWPDLNPRCDDLSLVENFMSKNHLASIIQGGICFIADPADGYMVEKGFSMDVCIQNFHNRHLPEDAHALVENNEDYDTNTKEKSKIIPI